MREYRRDVGRFLCGQSDLPPAAPSHYLEAPAEAAFTALTALPGDPDLMARCAAVAASANPTPVWRPAATALFRNWLRHIAMAKSAAVFAESGARKSDPISVGA